MISFKYAAYRKKTEIASSLKVVLLAMTDNAGCLNRSYYNITMLQFI